MNVKKLVSSREVIARTLNSFKIDNTDWIPRAALWIQDALFDMKLINTFAIKEVELEVENYKVLLPDGISKIEAISYNGVRLEKLGKLNVTSTGVTNKYIHQYSYELTVDGYLLFGFNEGDVTVYYRSMELETPTEAQEEEGYITYPMIPDNFNLKEALSYYIIYCMLRRGNKHSVYSLTAASDSVNAYRMWLVHRKKAQNSLSAKGFEERKLISQEIATLLPLREYDKEVFFEKHTVDSVVSSVDYPVYLGYITTAQQDEIDAGTSTFSDTVLSLDNSTQIEDLDIDSTNEITPVITCGWKDKFTISEFIGIYQYLAVPISYNSSFYDYYQNVDFPASQGAYNTKGTIEYHTLDGIEYRVYKLNLTSLINYKLSINPFENE